MENTEKGLHRIIRAAVDEQLTVLYFFVKAARQRSACVIFRRMRRRPTLPGAEGTSGCRHGLSSQKLKNINDNAESETAIYQARAESADEK